MMGTGSFVVQRMGEEQGPYSVPELQLQVRSNQLRGESMVRKAEGGTTWFRAMEIPGLFSDRTG